MKINKDFRLSKVGNSYMAIATGEARKSFDGMIRVNKSGEFLWNELKNDISYDELFEKVCAKYDEKPEILKKDMDEFLQGLLKIGALENGKHEYRA